MMKKIYEKPDAEYVSLIAREEISSGSFGDDTQNYSSGGDFAEGETGIESSIF